MKWNENVKCVTGRPTNEQKGQKEFVKLVNTVYELKEKIFILSLEASKKLLDEGKNRACNKAT